MAPAARELLWLPLATALAWGCASAGRAPGDAMTRKDPMLERFTGVDLDLAHAARRMGGFRPTPASSKRIADDALMTSMDWCDRMFRVPIHRVGDGLRHAYRVADDTVGVDLLEHRLDVDGVPVTVYESVTSFVVVIPAAALAPAEPLEKAATAARLVFAMEGPVTFRPMASDPARPFASTNPRCSLLASPGSEPLSRWSDRIDASLGEEISLIVYKVTWDDMNTLFRNPATWFRELRTLPGR